MNLQAKELIDLEKHFWRCLVTGDTAGALSLLAEPAVMISGHGVGKFDHAAYRRMAEQGPMTLKEFSLSEVDVEFPSENVALVTYQVRQTVGQRESGDEIVQQMADSSTWVRQDGAWLCAMHTETELNG